MVLTVVLQGTSQKSAATRFPTAVGNVQKVRRLRERTRVGPVNQGETQIRGYCSPLNCVTQVGTRTRTMLCSYSLQGRVQAGWIADLVPDQGCEIA